ncbi:hypothetical protein [Streptomyces sp. NPDC054961]
MTLATVLILVAVLAFVVFLALAPHAPVRSNPFPGRRRRVTRRRSATARRGGIPGQRGIQHHAR